MKLDDRAGLWFWGRKFRHATKDVNENQRAVVVDYCDVCHSTSQVEYERLGPLWWGRRCLTCKAQEQDR